MYRLFTLALIIPLLLPFAREKPAERDFEKWLKEDVAYIITPEEEEVFKKLLTPEERLNFIEQFWARRGGEEARAEHYRRIQYANDHFSSGVKGWRTDRGRIYIKYGPPDEIERHPSGGQYVRPYWEGGGVTSTYPFEIWRYRYIEGVGQDIEIEFVDDTLSGEYRIAKDPEEKDALLYFPNAGPTHAEQLGEMTRADRILLRSLPKSFQRLKDLPFQRLEQLHGLEKAPPIKFKDLEAVVSARISYHQLSLAAASSHIRIKEDLALVPVTLSIENKDLTFKQENGSHRATINLYGQLETLNRRVELKFDDSIMLEYPDKSALQAGLNKSSLYQKQLSLRPGRYKLSLVAKDANSGKIGTIEQLLLVPQYPTDRLALSSIVLADRVGLASERDGPLDPFVIGGFKIYPNSKHQFEPGKTIYIYFEVYNPSFDQSQSRPAVDLKLTLLGDGREIISGSLNRYAYFLDDRIAVLAQLSTPKRIDSARYSLRITAFDPISQQQAAAETTFEVKR